MSEFKIIQVNKGAKFLGKVKSTKDKRAEEIKKNVNLLKIQKNIRAFLTSMRFGGPECPLLIRKTQQIVRDREYIEHLWMRSQQLPLILKVRITTLTVQTLMQDNFLNVNIEKVLLAITEQGQSNRNLKIHHFEFLIEKYFEMMCFTNLLTGLMRIPNFKAAFERSLSHKITRLVFLVQQVKDINLTNQIIESYYKNIKTKIDDQNDQESLQQLRLCFQKTVQMLFASIQAKYNEDHLLYLMSIILQKLKSKYIEIILKRYKIDRSLFRSVQFREEIKELLEEKDEWKQYEDSLLPLTHLLPHFLSKFYKSSLFSVEFILKIVLEITKFNQTFGTLKLQNDQFFILLQKLDSKGLLNKQQFELKQYELLFTVIIIQKYLESINDIQFVNQFRFQKERMSRFIKTYVIKFMKDMCSLSSQSEITQEVLRHSELLMSNLYNKLFRTNLLSTTIFEDNSLAVFLATNKLNSNTKFYNQMVKILERSPFLLPIDTRFMMFKNMVKQDRHSAFFHLENIQLRVRRYHQFEDTFNVLYKKSLKNRIRVVFINEHGMTEHGIDGGGLTKQLLTRVFKVAFDPKFGLFIQNDKKQLMPNPQYQGITEGQTQANMYEFVGQLLGKSLYQNIMLGVKFAGPFLNLLINKRNTFDDLLTIDPELYKSVVYIMGMQQGVEDLQLTFLYQDHINKKYINLVPQGHLLKVTDQNKMQYLNLLVNYKVNHSFERQTRFIRKGLRQMIKEKWLEIFNYAQLNYLISGSGTIDVNDWKNHTIYRGVKDHSYIDAFWKIVRQFSEQQKSLLLKFVTSCQRPSFLGFRDLSPPFCISIVDSGLSLPTSHTCSNVLDLPIYTSVQMLKQKLLYAIKSGAGFQFA